MKENDEYFKREIERKTPKYQMFKVNNLSPIRSVLLHGVQSSLVQLIF